MVRILTPWSGVQVLFRELISCKLRGTAKGGQKKKKINENLNNKTENQRALTDLKKLNKIK